MNINDNLSIRLFTIVKDKQYIYQNTILGYFEIFLKEPALLTTKAVDSEKYNSVLLFKVALSLSALARSNINTDIKKLKIKRKFKLLLNESNFENIFFASF